MKYYLHVTLRNVYRDPNWSMFNPFISSMWMVQPFSQLLPHKPFRIFSSCFNIFFCPPFFPFSSHQNSVLDRLGCKFPSHWVCFHEWSREENHLQGHGHWSLAQWPHCGSLWEKNRVDRCQVKCSQHPYWHSEMLIPPCRNVNCIKWNVVMDNMDMKSPGQAHVQNVHWFNFPASCGITQSPGSLCLSMCPPWHLSMQAPS